MAQMTTLVTGFEPFGGASVNVSEEIVTALAALGRPGLVTAVLPTSYRRSEAAIGELLHRHRPATVLLLGLAGSAEKLRLEQVALNLNDAAAPDNDGECRERRPIVEEAPVAYRSTLPLERMAATARRLGEEVEFSRDAGGYVCNHVFFTAAHLAATTFPETRTGFVHLPDLGPDVGKAEPRLQRFVDILQTWIEEA